jgi:ribosomal protein L31
MNNKPYNQNTMKKLVTLENRVEKLLKKYKFLRNDNKSLCVKVWEQQFDERKDITSNFFAMYESGKYVSADNITRIARLVKQYNPELRGTNDKDNKKKAQLIKPLLKK